MVIDMKSTYPLMFVLLTVSSTLHAAKPEPPSRGSAVAVPAITQLDAKAGIRASEVSSAGVDILKRVQSFKLSSAITGPFDHFAVDLTNNRLFASAESYHAVLVLDINTGEVVHEIKGLLKPHAILYREDLNRLYNGSPGLWQADYDYAGFQWIGCNDRDASVLSFLRQTSDGKNQTVVILNLTPVPRLDYRIGLPREGKWSERLNSDAAIYGGSNNGNCGSVTAEKISNHGQPCSANFYLPPMSVMVFQQGG